MSSQSSDTVPFGLYLFTRLTQLGCHSIHGLPGDYNLTLLDHVVPSGARWVGNCNELNAGYAADGYARVMSLYSATSASTSSSLVPGCLVTTYGVGELSALNAIAGAYAERVPLIHIVGTPRRELAQNQTFIHHALDAGDYGRFREASRSMVCHVARVGVNDEWDAEREVKIVEQAFEACLRESRPVYIDVPADIVDELVPRRFLEENGRVEVSNGEGSLEEVDEVVARIQSAKMPVIIVDGESLSLGLLPQVNDFVRKSGVPTFCSIFGKGMIDETIPNFMGIHAGVKGPRPYQDIFDEADLIIIFGPHYSDTNTMFFETVPDAKKTISFDRNMHGGAKNVLEQVVKRLDFGKVQGIREEHAARATRTLVQESSTPKQDTSIDQESFYVRISSFFREGDVICSETGTTGVGCRDFILPKHSMLLKPVTWLSIGYMLGAAQGAALAVKDLLAAGGSHLSGRTILFEGDGSFQLTFQEISTMVRHNLNVIIFVVNNYGYTIEKCIHGWEEEYNNVANWNYLESLNVFRGGRNNEETGEKYTWRVENWGQLLEAMNDKRLSDGKGVRMVEVIMDAEDAPLALIQATGDRRPSRLKNGTALQT